MGKLSNSILLREVTRFFEVVRMALALASLFLF